MNAMGHRVPNMLGVDQSGLEQKIAALVPDYMSVGAMQNMDQPMALPENTLPMTGGAGPYGSIEMGGMFTVVKIRPALAPGDYRDPGWYRPPPNTVAYLWKGEAPPRAAVE
jgi:hypothetical protein